MTRDAIADIIRNAQGCGIGHYAADGNWVTICCNDERLKGDKHHYFEECDCSKAADAIHAALDAQQDGVREVLDEALVTLSHARLFVTSPQKMHPDGVKLYDELIDRLKGLEQKYAGFACGQPANTCGPLTENSKCVQRTTKA